MVRADRAAPARPPVPDFPFRAFLGPSLFSALISFATVAFQIEREDAVKACGASKNLGMAQRAQCIVISRAPMVLHREPGKLIVFRVTFILPGPVDQVDDVVDLVTRDRLQDSNHRSPQDRREVCAVELPEPVVPDARS
jgi:hypothetical protein